jgi:hypothetical protein
LIGEELRATFNGKKTPAIGEFPMKSAVLAAAAAFALTGCALFGPSRISHSTVDPAYRLNEVFYAGAPGAMRTVVTGDPFGVGRERFDEAVTEAMYGHHFGPDMEFVTDPAEDLNRHYRVVMMFDAPLSTGGRAICEARPELQSASATPTAVAPAPDQPVRVLAAFCRDDLPLTDLAGVMARTSVDDPAFERFVAQMTMRLFPASNPEAVPDHDDGEILIPGF